jgi:hypothetical protein
MENVFPTNWTAYQRTVREGSDDKPILREALASVGGAYPLPCGVQTLAPLAGCVPCVIGLSIEPDALVRPQGEAIGSESVRSVLAPLQPVGHSHTPRMGCLGLPLNSKVWVFSDHSLPFPWQG